MKDITYKTLLSTAQSQGYKVFQNDTKPYNLNIWGIRADNPKPNQFDDLIILWWKYKGLWSMRKFAATTDPGLYYLNNPLSPQGTAIMREGQHVGMWGIGLHQGKYEALKQVKPITVTRDYNKDNKLDFESGRTETGMFGINCHRANANGNSIQVDRWSAGCQVLQNRKIKQPGDKLPTYEFDYFMSICNESADLYGNSFTYTLVSEKNLADA